MTWQGWLGGIVMFGGLALALYFAWPKRDADRVSDHWLTDADRRLNQRGIDGVTWQWPVDKSAWDA